MTDVSVVHLVRGCNGSAPLRRFLESYRNHPAGKEHELVIVFKGFPDGRPGREILELLADFPVRSLSVDDRGFDIGAYFTAAKALSSRYLCFLNSFSTLRGDNWLLKLYRQIDDAGVGMAGATGSFESFYTDNLREQYCSYNPKDMLFRWWQLRKFRAWFAPFPNPHLRTNGFIISRERMVRIGHGVIADKMDAHRFESGREGLSSWIRSEGLSLVIVGRDGTVYREQEWPLSNTFRLGSQSNLLIGDNQTEQYDKEDAVGRGKLSCLSWGVARQDEVGY